MNNIDLIIELAKTKIQLKLWSSGYAKGYCYAILNEVYSERITDSEYNEYAKQINDF